MKPSIDSQLEELSDHIEQMEVSLIEMKKLLRNLLKKKHKMTQMEEMLRVIKDMEKAL
jgi:hypothetical protein